MALQLESILNSEDDETFMADEKKVSRRGFIGMLAGLGATVLGSKAVAKENEWSHPLYEILFRNAKDQELRKAIYALDKKDYNTAAYILIPDYNPNDPRNLVGRGKRMKNPGGDNPTYWVALRLTYEGIGYASSYEIPFRNLGRSRDILLPKNQTILEFAKSIVLKSKKDWILSKYPEKRERNHDKMIVTMQNSGMFNL